METEKRRITSACSRQAGVDPVPDAARARHDAVGEGGGKRHAGRAAKQRRLHADPRTQSGLLQEHQASWPPREEHHVRIHRSIPERRIDYDPGSPGQARDARHFLHFDGADARHEGERLLEFLRAFRREGNVMRVAANRAVVMVTGRGVEGPPLRGDPLETAPRWFRSRELRYPRRRGVSERDGDGPPLEVDGLGEALLYAAIVRHLVSPSVQRVRHFMGRRAKCSAKGPTRVGKYSCPRAGSTLDTVDLSAMIDILCITRERSRLT